MITVNVSHSQTGGEKFVTIAENDSLSLKIIQEVSSSKYYLLATSNRKIKDTIQIDLNDENQYEIIHCDLKAKQLDRKGRKEVVIETELSLSYGGGLNGEGVAFKILQIWNLDSRTKMFNAKKSYTYSGTAGEYSDDFEVVDGDTTFYLEACPWECIFSYEVDFQESLKSTDILIKGLKKLNYNECKEDYTLRCEEPDHKEGTYIIKNGVYIRNEEKTE